MGTHPLLASPDPVLLRTHRKFLQVREGPSFAASPSARRKWARTLGMSVERLAAPLLSYPAKLSGGTGMSARNEAGAVVASKVGRVFERDPDRVASAWRRLRYAEGPQGVVPDNILDNVIESFVGELGATMSGAPGTAWGRARGVLRLSPERGLKTLLEELSALRRCLLDAADALEGAASERAAICFAVEEATSSATALYAQLMDPLAPHAAAPAGIIVVEYFERAA